MRVAVVGGGINGLCIAECLAERGHEVILFERGKRMSQTSRASSKLLHGGLRYLETLQFRFVHEALLERHWWLENCPRLTNRLQITFPVFRRHNRPAWQIALGLAMYQRLAGRRAIGPWHRLSANELLKRSPYLKGDGLVTAFTFYDGQMDDYALGMWIADRARQHGAQLRENAPITRLGTDGVVEVAGNREQFDFVVNVAGPWAEQVLTDSGLEPRHHLQWVRGSHLLFEDAMEHAWLLRTPQDSRVFFVLPWRGKTLVGTTEARQAVTDPIRPSNSEIDYLLNAYNYYFRRQRARGEILDTMAGVRPLLASKGSMTRASRESVLDSEGRLLTVYGGKWTSARSLARKVADRVKV